MSSHCCVVCFLIGIVMQGGVYLIKHCTYWLQFPTNLKCCCFREYIKASPECQAARFAEGAKQQFS